MTIDYGTDEPDAHTLADADDAQAQPQAVVLLGTADDVGLSQMSSSTYRLEVDGTEYYLERWCTNNSSGEEWYTASGEPTKDPTDDELSSLFDVPFVSDLIDDQVAAYAIAYEKAAAEVGLDSLLLHCKAAATLASAKVARKQLTEMRAAAARAADSGEDD